MPKRSQGLEPYLIFLSHSEKDRWIAKQLAASIEGGGKRHGVKVFMYEKHIESGDPIPESIRRNILNCTEFLVLMSRYSIDRPWVLVEMGAAWVLGKRIVAVMDKVAPEEIPLILLAYKAIDLNDFDQYVQELLNRVKESRR